MTLAAGDLVETLRGAPEEAAPLLLGCELVSTVGGETVRMRVTEVEAYKGPDDPASHAYRGWTSRNDSMFRRPGTLYVYRSYGIHHCANTAAGPPGTGWGILIRGGQVMEGEAAVRRRRGRVSQLTDGPGKVCQALGIEMAHNGLYLLDSDAVIRLQPGPPPPVVIATPRIGISTAKERPWRFVAAATAG